MTLAYQLFLLSVSESEIWVWGQVLYYRVCIEKKRMPPVASWEMCLYHTKDFSEFKTTLVIRWINILASIFTWEKEVELSSILCKTSYAKA